MKTQSRREFIKTSAKLGVAVAATGLSPLLASNSGVNSNKNSQNSVNLNANSSNKSGANTANSTKGQNMQNTQNNPQVWFITGASGGLGFALAKYLLEKGDKVAVTSRKKGVEAKFKGLATDDNFLPLVLTFDKNIDKQVSQNLAQIQKKFGRLDNVVNNAGYGLLGFVEEVSERQLRQQFEVNVFAPFIVAQNALKIMRPQALSEGGNAQNIKARIYNISSIGGFKVSQCASVYCMSKFALSALSEGLDLDTLPFGVAAVNVMPGGFRTEFFGTSKNFGDLRVKDYDERRESYKARTDTFNGKQAGNPEKFAEVIFEISRMKKPPQHLFMSEGAFRLAREKIATIEANITATESYAGAAVDFQS